MCVLLEWLESWNIFVFALAHGVFRIRQMLLHSCQITVYAVIWVAKRAWVDVRGWHSLSDAWLLVINEYINAVNMGSLFVVFPMLSGHVKTWRKYCMTSAPQHNTQRSFPQEPTANCIVSINRHHCSSAYIIVSVFSYCTSHGMVWLWMRAWVVDLSSWHKVCVARVNIVINKYINAVNTLV